MMGMAQTKMVHDTEESEVREGPASNPAITCGSYRMVLHSLEFHTSDDSAITLTFDSEESETGDDESSEKDFDIYNAPKEVVEENYRAMKEFEEAFAPFIKRDDDHAIVRVIKEMYAWMLLVFWFWKIVLHVLVFLVKRIVSTETESDQRRTTSTASSTDRQEEGKDQKFE